MMEMKQQPPPFHGHYTGQPALVQSFTARMPLLTATSAFGLGRKKTLEFSLTVLSTLFP